ncbi:MAG: putative quinol monooxygenase [Labrenzia sp.]
MKAVPRPDHWFSYKPIPEMKGKSMGVFAHVVVEDGAQEKVKDIYPNIVDIAIEEKTCTVLSASTSLVDTKNHLLYEEWTDYEEFFEVQFARPYRNGFMRWLLPIMSKPLSAEFTEILHSTGPHPYNVRQNSFSLMKSIHVSSGREDDARKFFIEYINQVGQDSFNLHANIHQSLNNPQHFIIYEVWRNLSYLVEDDMKGDRRCELDRRCDELADHELPEPAMEIFQIYYDPEKYKMPKGS